jgi:hypothetical protein
LTARIRTARTTQSFALGFIDATMNDVARVADVSIAMGSVVIGG